MLHSGLAAASDDCAGDLPQVGVSTASDPGAPPMPRRGNTARPCVAPRALSSAAGLVARPWFSARSRPRAPAQTEPVGHGSCISGPGPVPGLRPSRAYHDDPHAGTVTGPPQASSPPGPMGTSFRRGVPSGFRTCVDSGWCHQVSLSAIASDQQGCLPPFMIVDPPGPGSGHEPCSGP